MYLCVFYYFLFFVSVITISDKWFTLIIITTRVVSDRELDLVGVLSRFKIRCIILKTTKTTIKGKMHYATLVCFLIVFQKNSTI